MFCLFGVGVLDASLCIYVGFGKFVVWILWFVCFVISGVVYLDTCIRVLGEVVVFGNFLVWYLVFLGFADFVCLVLGALGLFGFGFYGFGVLFCGGLWWLGLMMVGFDGCGGVCQISPF